MSAVPWAGPGLPGAWEVATVWSGASPDTVPQGPHSWWGACLQVELEMAIDTLNPNYCRSKGEQIALNVDGACADETSTYSS